MIITTPVRKWQYGWHARTDEPHQRITHIHILSSPTMQGNLRYMFAKYKQYWPNTSICMLPILDQIPTHGRCVIIYLAWFYLRTSSLVTATHREAAGFWVTAPSITEGHSDHSFLPSTRSMTADKSMSMTPSQSSADHGHAALLVCSVLFRHSNLLIAYFL